MESVMDFNQWVMGVEKVEGFHKWVGMVEMVEVSDGYLAVIMSSDRWVVVAVMTDDGKIGFNNYHILTGQKRGFPFPGVERSPGKEGASFAKLFVGSVPRTVIEDDVRYSIDEWECSKFSSTIDHLVTPCI